MPAVITHQMTMLLTRKRLKEISVITGNRIEKKKASPIDFHMHFLAENAYRMLSGAQPIMVKKDEGEQISKSRLDAIKVSTALNTISESYLKHPLNKLGSPFEEKKFDNLNDTEKEYYKYVSKFACMGCMGPDIMAFSAHLTNHQAYPFDTVHKGCFDGDREMINAGTTDLPLEIWHQFRKNNKDVRDITNIRAYVLGHLTHVATDVISHPYVNDIEWHTKESKEFWDEHEEIRDAKGGMHAWSEGDIDAELARLFFNLTDSARDSEGLDTSWPSNIPDGFFTSYSNAVKAVYKIRVEEVNTVYNDDNPDSRDWTIKGFGEGNEELKADNIEKLDGDFVEDGYNVFRKGVLEVYYSWEGGSFLLLGLPILLLPTIIFPLACLVYKDNNEILTQWGGQRNYIANLSYANLVGHPIQLFYLIFVMSLTTKGHTKKMWAYFSYFILSFIMNTTILVQEVKNKTEKKDTWRFVYSLLYSFFGAFLLFVGIHGSLRKDHSTYEKVICGLIAFAIGIPVLCGVFFYCAKALYRGFCDKNSEESIVGKTFWQTSGAMFLLSILLWLIGWLWIYKNKITKKFPFPSKPRFFSGTDDEDSKKNFLDERHYVATFEDKDLISHRSESTPIGLKSFPPGRRKLIDITIKPGKGFSVFTTENIVTITKGHKSFAYPTPQRSDALDVYAKAFEEELKTAFVEETELEISVKKSYPHEPDVALANRIPFSLDDKPVDLNKDNKYTYSIKHPHKSDLAISYSSKGILQYSSKDTLSKLGAGTISINDKINIKGKNTCFTTFFTKGDIIVCKDANYEIKEIIDNTNLTITKETTNDISGLKYYRKGTFKANESINGFKYICKPTSDSETYVDPKDTIMDYATDLSAMLCMGAVPHLLDKDNTKHSFDLPKNSHTTGNNAKVGKVAQVFRNWSLDRRRINEWKMLVAGGASQDQDTSNGKQVRDTMMMAKTKLDKMEWKAWSKADSEAAIATQNSKGWIPLLRDWLKNPQADVTKAMAHLFDLPVDLVKGE